jgi:enoyl-CoA hydratase/carnithine racemase
VSAADGTGSDRVLLDVVDGLATVTLNRPEKLNAIDYETYVTLARLADELALRDDVRAIVLTGAGRAFCAGADLTEFADQIDFDDAHMVRDRLRFVGSVVSKWVKLDRPTLAAVNGIAIGGGCNLALMCDLVLMRADATIGQTYVQRGLVMDMGGTYFLPRLVGRALANELGLLGDAIVQEWGTRLARGAGRAQRMIKAGLLASPLLDLDAMLEWEASGIAMIFQTEDLRESFAAFREKRDPVFEGR